MTTTLDAATLRADLEQLQRARWGGIESVTYQGNGVNRAGHVQNRCADGERR